MAIWRSTKSKQQKPRSPLAFLLIAAVSIGLIWIMLSSSIPVSVFSLAPSIAREKETSSGLERKYLYWGNRIDCPGKHCDSCAGLGHQESSLRCALEEALFLKRLRMVIHNCFKIHEHCILHWMLMEVDFLFPCRVFVVPSRICINPIHNDKGILHPLIDASSEERWAASSCAMDSLYDLNLISKTVPVIFDNSKVWYHVLSTSMKLGNRGVAHIKGTSRTDLNDSKKYSNVLLINRTASPLAWFMECKDRTNRSSVLLPYSVLPMSAAPKLRDVAAKITELLGDYDAIHIRRGDKIKTRKDRFGVSRSLHPHLDRDTRPEFIRRRILKWITPGRTLFIASNERKPDYFSALSTWYKLAYSSNYSSILDPVIENNYQLFVVERLILAGARTFIKTFKEYEGDLSLTDDPKKNTKNWQIPVYTMEEEGR